MRIDDAEMLFLEIPFRLALSHGARSDRRSSDSVILRLRSRDHEGFGEAVVRDYVSGSLGTGEAFQRETGRIVGDLLRPLAGRDFTWREAESCLAALPCSAPALPLMCAVETALLACAVAERGAAGSPADPWSVLEREPLRQVVVYGGVLPFVSPEAARTYLPLCARLKLSNLKVKVGRDPAYNRGILALCREILGTEFDLRVDANAAWSLSSCAEHLDVCREHGVRLIEQPFPVSEGPAAGAALAAQGFSVMADEGVLTGSDVRSLAATGAAQALNLRLSKNGGLARVLALAAEAESNGLSYQMGCMVGETGVLSAMGRVAASLLPAPRYVEGSYDEMLLEENIVTPSFGFGPGGRAPIDRGNGMGYRVDAERLARFTRARIRP
ncbi:MAG TPA: enolase C-terminal domain-like protein [Spirochaetia bacterium]|nr:enolase C-terminal domain-like protein [Spirochaetia bacterium]